MSFENCRARGGAGGLGLLTAACGNNPTDRALTGGAIGAGTGAVVGSTVGAPIAAQSLAARRARHWRGDDAGAALLSEREARLKSLVSPVAPGPLRAGSSIHR